MLAVPEATAVTTNVPAELPAATVATAVLELLAVIPLAPVAVTDCVVPAAFSETELGEALIAGNCGLCVGVVTGGDDPPPPHPGSAASAMIRASRFIIGHNSWWKVCVIVGLCLANRTRNIPPPRVVFCSHARAS